MARIRSRFAFDLDEARAEAAIVAFRRRLSEDRAEESVERLADELGISRADMEAMVAEEAELQRWRGTR